MRTDGRTDMTKIIVAFRNFFERAQQANRRAVTWSGCHRERQLLRGGVKSITSRYFWHIVRCVWGRTVVVVDSWRNASCVVGSPARHFHLLSCVRLHNFRRVRRAAAWCVPPAQPQSWLACSSVFPFLQPDVGIVPLNQPRPLPHLFRCYNPIALYIVLL